MKKYVKIISILLSLIFIASTVSMLSFSVSINSGIDALRNQWSRSKGPSGGGYALEYSYFIPKDVSAKAPLFVFMAGIGEGSSAGKELTANNIANWSSDEYQSRVANASGAYIMILRAPEPVYFDTCPPEASYAAINDFANKNNVDKDRIYVLGWSLGASGVAKLALKYPDYFAGVSLIAPRTTISSSEADKLKNMAVWVLNSKNDSYSVFGLYASPSWDNIKSKAVNKSKVRFTTSSDAPNAGALLNHNMWRLTEYDYADAVGSYSSLKTIDGNGNTVSSPEFIHWFSSWTRTTDSGSSTQPTTQPSSDSDGEQSQNSEPKQSFFQKILAFFRALLEILFG